MRTSRRSLAVLAGAALALGPALPAAASHDVTPARIGDGAPDRYATAAEIALADHPDGSSEVIIASGEQYPDALSGAPIAAELDAPILLVAPNHVPDVTISALDELDPDRATILGGNAAVSDEVEETLQDTGEAATDRIYGTNRYETAAQIAREVQARNDNAANWPGGQRAAFLTTGQDFPDALSAGALAASRDGAPIPILLTPSDQLAPSTADAIEDLDIEVVVIIGGSQAVSDQVQDTVDDDDTTTDRVGGTSRTETATEVADYAIQYLGFDEDDITLTRGDNFPDALTIAPVSGANRNPILLTATPELLSEPTRTWLNQACGAVDRIRAVGGTAAVSEQVLEDAELAAENCHGEQGSDQDLLVEPQEAITTSPGESQEFELVRTYDGGDVTTPTDVALFPCEEIREPTDGDFRFTDDESDGNADGIESTDTDVATITAINGDDVQDVRGARDLEPGGTEAGIQVTVTADADDCAGVVFFEDTNDDSALNLGTDGLPTEPWGFGLIRWVS